MVRTDGRAYGHVITKFSRMGRLPHFLRYGAPSTRALRARVEVRYKDLYGKKPIVSVTYENERISIKNSLPYLKCVLRLSCVVHGPIYGRFMGFYVNGFLCI